MKNIITIMILLVGCATTPTVKSVVGSYEPKLGKDTSQFQQLLNLKSKLVFLENGKVKIFYNGEKIDEGTWKIVGKEVHVKNGKAGVIFKAKPNGDLYWTSITGEGKKELPKSSIWQDFKKLKE